MRVFFVVLALIALVGCKQEPPKLDSGLKGYDPDLIETERAACAERGGRFGQGGFAGSFLCYEETRDANKACRRESDCEGLCLARSRSCAPIKPLFGCNEILTEAGFPATVCID